MEQFEFGSVVEPETNRNFFCNSKITLLCKSKCLEITKITFFFKFPSGKAFFHRSKLKKIKLDFNFLNSRGLGMFHVFQFLKQEQ